MKNIFVKQLVIAFFYTTLTTFFNLCEIAEATDNNLERRL